jgi:hypothetical protein
MRKQRGVTMIGWVILLIPIALVIYAGIRVGPEYFNYYKVLTAMKESSKALESDETLSPRTIRSALEKRFDTGYVDNPTADEIEIAKVEGGWDMTAAYESRVPMFGNLYLLLDFNKTIKIETN